jgi:hypothetical protein
LETTGSDFSTGDFNIDHIIPNFWGGLDHPRNYFIMCGCLNKSLGALISKEKIAHIGTHARSAASSYSKYMRQQMLDNGVDTNSQAYVMA